MAMQRAEILSEVKKLLADQLSFEATGEAAAGAATEDTTLSEDLGLDSLDCVELMIAIEETLGIEVSEENLTGWKNVGDVVSCVAAKNPAGPAPL